MESLEPSGELVRILGHAANTLFQWRLPIFPNIIGDKVYL